MFCLSVNLKCPPENIYQSRVFKSEFQNIIAFFLKVFLNFDNHTFLVLLRCLPSVEEN